MARPLLLQQPAPVDRKAAARTARFLAPAGDALAALFLELRAETDQALGRGLPGQPGQAYPLGYCREITLDVLGRLKVRLPRPRDAGTRALHAFLRAGGSGRCVWGALRGRYFQTALQFDGLYVDVANDTVTVTKPKVEILPMAASGLEAVRGVAHYARIASAYWGMRVYSNTALPSLAPVLPMIGVLPGTGARLQSPTDYMTGLLCQDRFVQSEAWLAEGPAPPDALVADLRQRCPADLLAANPRPGTAAALAACRAARADGRATDLEWRNRAITSLLRFQAASANSAAA